MTQSNAPDIGFLFIVDFVEIAGKFTNDFAGSCLNDAFNHESE